MGLPNKERQRAWRAANPEKAKAHNTDRYYADPKKAIENIKINNRRRRQGMVVIDRVDRSVVWERDGGICGICGAQADPEFWHLDHVVPVKQGGVHSYENVQVSHPACNDRKGAALIDRRPGAV